MLSEDFFALADSESRAAAGRLLFGSMAGGDKVSHKK